MTRRVLILVVMVAAASVGLGAGAASGAGPASGGSPVVVDAVAACTGGWERRGACALTWAGGAVQLGALSHEYPGTLRMELWWADRQAGACGSFGLPSSSPVFPLQCEVDPSGLFGIEIGVPLTCVVHGDPDPAGVERGRGHFGCANSMVGRT